MINDTISIDEYNTGKRIDKVISDIYEDVSRTHIQNLISSGKIIVNGKEVKTNYKLTTGDEISIYIPDPVEPEIIPEDIPLDILYEDDDLIVVNKPKQMVVHPAKGHYSGTLVNALMHHCRDNLSGINGVMRPGIVHRIDMDTTGALLVCKNDFSHNHIAEQLKSHSITRAYEAIVHNVPKSNTGTIDAKIGRHPNDRLKMAININNGKEAITHYKVLEKFNGFAHIECRLETGRTHQIRVHMSSIGHPLLGDVIYGPNRCPFNLQGQTLHAKLLGFIHPRTGEYMEFIAKRPDYFEHLIEILRTK